MPSKTPLALTKERFGDKSKLVEAVKALATDDLWMPRTNADRGGERGLEHVSNAKLLKLHATLTEVKQKFGTRAKLVEAILEADKRTKDAGLRKRLEGYPAPRLLDMYKTRAKRSARASAAAAKAQKS